MNDCFRYKPPNTIWIGCELFVKYNCGNEPEVINLIITGINQIGFFASHQYIVNASVEDFWPMVCQKEECERAIRYKFDVRFNVYEKVGVGFGLGVGTTTFGWQRASKEYVETFTTRCICCDDKKLFFQKHVLQEEPWRLPVNLQPRVETGIAAVAAFSAVGAGVAISLTNIEQPIAQGFLWFTGASTLVSLLLTVIRSLRFGIEKGEGIKIKEKAE